MKQYLITLPCEIIVDAVDVESANKAVWKEISLADKETVFDFDMANAVCVEYQPPTNKQFSDDMLKRYNEINT